jgi:hypothetical protein
MVISVVLGSPLAPRHAAARASANTAQRATAPAAMMAIMVASTSAFPFFILSVAMQLAQSLATALSLHLPHRQLVTRRK